MGRLAGGPWGYYDFTLSGLRFVLIFLAATREEEQ